MRTSAYGFRPAVSQMGLFLGISDALIRLSVGIEDADDLIADLDRVLLARAFRA